MKLPAAPESNIAFVDRMLPWNVSWTGTSIQWVVWIEELSKLTLQSALEEDASGIQLANVLLVRNISKGGS